MKVLNFTHVKFEGHLKREMPALPSVTDTAILSLKGRHPGRDVPKEPYLYFSLIHQRPPLTTKRIKDTQGRGK